MVSPMIAVLFFGSKEENKETSRVFEEHHALLREAVALNQNRILLRLRSRHAKSQSNFAKRKMQRPKLIPQLCEAMEKLTPSRTSRVPSSVFVLLKADVGRLGGLFEGLENLSTPKARSRPGLDIIVDLVTKCQHVHNQRSLEQTLTGASGLEAKPRATIVRSITKLSRYSSVSELLLQASRGNAIFNQVRISTINVRAPKLAATEPDPKTKAFAHALVEKSRSGKLASKYPNPSVSEIENHIRREATMPVPVHAEIQLLFHYEWNPCSLPPRIICSSKQACFLCNLFLRIHGQFAVPSTHGRMYEKWALPAGIQNIEDADGNVLTKCRDFVSTIEGALQRELQSFRKPYPAPHESMILNSAVGSQSNSSRISAHDSLANGKSGFCERSSSIPSNETLSPKRLHMVHTEEAQITTATAGDSQSDPHSSQSKTSSSLTASAVDLPTAVPQAIDHHGENQNGNLSHVLLTEGRPIWCEISAANPAFEIRTPRIHLTITLDDTTQAEPGPEWDHYWVLLEHLPDHSIQDGEIVPDVDLLSIPIGHNMTLDYDSSERLRRLRVYSKSDVISITYSLQKPVDGVEHRS